MPKVKTEAHLLALLFMKCTQFHVSNGASGEENMIRCSKCKSGNVNRV